MKQIRNQLVAVVMVGAFLGCDSDTTAPSADGSAPMEIAVRGDDGGSGGISPNRVATQTSGSGSASGRIDVTARVYVRNWLGEWVTVGGTARQTVEASGSDGSRLLVRGTVQSSGYTRVRVEFDEVEAWVSSGITLGGGGLLTGTVAVDGGTDNRVIIEREVRFDARAESTSRLEINLNSDAWLKSANSSTRTVSEAEFASAVQISAR